MSLERAVESAAVFLLIAGAAFVVLWALLRGRLRRFGRVLLALSVLALAGGAGLGAWALHETRPRDVRGSPTIEFLPKLRPPQKPKPEKLVLAEPWPTYGYDRERTHLSPYPHRPPYRVLWTKKTHGVIEFPPTVANGIVYLASLSGRFWALDARRGTVVWQKVLGRCSPASPTVAGHVVYQAYMHPLPCTKHLPGARGFVVARNALTGQRLWTRGSGAVETSPLVVGKRVYVGSWDRRVYALDRRNGRLLWTFPTDDRITSSPAYANGTIYIASDNGRVYALSAQTGRLRWQAASFSRFGRREYFYATPTVAYGRVFIGNADGTVYAFGASSGRLIWARQVGTYVYTAAAVWRKILYVGTWDGYFVALDVRTGDVRWRFNAPGGITGAPTVMAGLVYFSTYGPFYQGGHQRRVESGPRSTFALDARTGRPVWRFGDGNYSPIVADQKRVYLVGFTTVYALAPRPARRKAKAHARARKRPAHTRARSRSAARRGTTSGKRGR